MFMNEQQTKIYNHWKTWKTTVFFNKNLTCMEFKRIYLTVIARSKTLGKDTTGDVMYTPHVPWCPAAQNSCYPGLISCWSHSTEQCTLSGTLLPWSARHLVDAGIHFAKPATIKTVTVTCMYISAWPCIKSDPASMFVYEMYPLAQDRSQLQPLTNVVMNCWVA